jgi:serine/threonine-protein kinase RsbW
MSPENEKNFKKSQERFNEEWILESKREEVDRAAQKIVGCLRDLGWSSDEAEGFELAITEAIANAVVHGNEEDINKKVTVALNLTKDDAEIVVTDEGKGFDPKEIPDPREGEGLTASHGRGIFLISNICDRVEFSDEGRTITLIKKRNSSIKNNAQR